MRTAFSGLHRSLWLFLGMALVAGAQAARTPQAAAPSASAPAVTPLRSGAAQPDAALVERGRYVALTADCQSCHTAPGAQPFSGGAGLETPFGAIYPPNITPDLKTGTGNWTQADFERALRQGVRKDGAALYPAMPYDSYTRMSDDDIAALWAYMRSVPAVAKATPENTLPFPFNQRAGMAVWQAAFFKPGRQQPVPGKSSEWNRGAYLVEGPGHCGACHTPRNVAQASETRHRLAGAEIQGWYAPDISNDSLSKLSGMGVDELAQLLKTGRQPGNVKTFGLMQEVVHDSLQHLSDADVRAMAVYLKDQPGGGKARAREASTVSPAQLASGQALYGTHCVSCHQANGRGVAGSVPALAGNGAIAAAQPTNVVMAVLQGFEPQGSWGAMASFANVLSDDEIADVANYVRSSWGNRGGKEATAASVGKLRSVAQVPDGGERAALVCPILSPQVLEPALKSGPAALKQAARDHAQLERLVRSYVAARPQAPVAQVVEALSTAYCRALAADGASAARAGTGMAEFSNEVAAQLLSNRALAARGKGASAKP